MCFNYKFEYIELFLPPRNKINMVMGHNLFSVVFLLLKNGFFSQTIYPDYTFTSLYSSSFLTTSSPLKTHSFPSLFKEEQASKRQEPNMKK